MPRRSSSQSHRIKELLEEAKTSPIPQPEEEPNQESSNVLTQVEDESFDFALYSLQCWATRLAVPPGSAKSKQGQRAAEKTLHYLQQGNLGKALQNRGEGRHNRAISPAERRQYDYNVFLNNQFS
jgi:hypothetical protein